MVRDLPICHSASSWGAVRVCIGVYIYVYLHVIIGGIGKTYAAQGKHSSHGERDNKGIKRVYTIPGTADSVYKRYLENVNDRIAQSLYDRYAAGKATHIPSCSKPNITFDLFYQQKIMIFLYIVFVYMYVAIYQK